jgi:transposase
MAPPLLRVRALTTDEAATIDRLRRARTEAAQTVLRAQVIWHSQQGQSVDAIAKTLGVSTAMVRKWVRRFNAQGMAGLQDAPKSGRPPTYSAEQVSTVVATALTDPQTLGLPFAAWTLDRLQAYLNEECAIGIKRSRIDDLLRSEGLRWRKQESWFGERVDPDFVEKRGPSSRSTRSRHPTAS